MEGPTLAYVNPKKRPSLIRNFSCVQIFEIEDEARYRVVDSKDELHYFDLFRTVPIA